MSTKILLQTILKLRDQIKTGAANFMDVSAEYFKSTGDFMDDSQKAIALEEINKIAPSNVTTLEGVDPRETIMPMGGVKGPNVKKAGEMSDTPVTDDVEETLGVKLRGDESFGELMEKLEGSPNKTLQKAFDKANKEEGIGSLFPKGKPGEIFDVDNSRREEVAEFEKKMRGAGISNKDIKGVFKESGTDLAQGKKAATTLARAADMKADTAIKQEALADLDDDIANYGPNWWKGLGYNDGPMGYESYGEMSRAMIGRINNGIMDDLEKAGVPEEKVTEIFTFLSDTRKRLANDPKAFVRKVADELEIEDIDYDVSFWDNYVDEIMSRIEKPEPRFEYGGMV